MSIDLTNLKPIELPTREIEIQIKGDYKTDPETGEKTPNIQKITVHAISGEGMIAWRTNGRNNQQSVEFEARACITALVYGADIPEDKARLLVNYDRETANKINVAVWLLTGNFYAAEKAEAEAAEKNSEAAEVSSGD